MRIKWRYKPSERGVCAVVCDWSNLSSKGESGEVRYSVTQTETADCVCVEIELLCKAWSCLTLQQHSGRPKISGSCSVTQEPSHYSVCVKMHCTYSISMFPSSFPSSSSWSSPSLQFPLLPPLFHIFSKLTYSNTDHKASDCSRQMRACWTIHHCEGGRAHKTTRHQVCSTECWHITACEEAQQHLRPLLLSFTLTEPPPSHFFVTVCDFLQARDKNTTPTLPYVILSPLDVSVDFLVE